MGLYLCRAIFPPGCMYCHEHKNQDKDFVAVLAQIATLAALKALKGRKSPK